MRPALKLALALFASLACSRTSGGPRAALTRFPIGIYGVNEPKHLARLKEDGFDSFHTYASDPLLLASLAKEAKRQGMRMVIYPDKVREADPALTRNWPVDAWYLLDEPDVVKMSSAALQALSDKTRAWDPVRPQTFVIGQGAPAKVYGGVGDILMMDWYPVPHKPTDSVADQIDLVMAAIPKGKPFWMVLQAYDWADEVTDPVKRKGLRFPDHFEIRFMSYISVLHGARGLFYFTLAKQGKTLFEYPELWQAVARVSREMKAMQPIFERGTPMRLPFAPDVNLVARAWRYHGRDYVVILNRRKMFQQKVPDALLSREWRPLAEDRRDPRDLLKSAYGAWYLKPYQVMVFESPIRWRELF